MLNVLNAPYALGRDLTANGHQQPRPDNSWNLATLIAIVRRRIGIVVLALLVCLALAALYLLLATPRFTATTTLMPDLKRTPPAPNEVASESLPDPAVVESQIETLRSDRIALAVIDRLSLWKDPEFVGEGPGTLARLLALAGIGARSEAAEREIKRQAAAGSFGRMLKVLRVGRSYLTEIAFTSTDRVKAATIANEIAEAYIQDQLGAKFSNADRSGRWMRQRITELERDIGATTQSIQDYKAANNLNIDASGKPALLREQEELAGSLEQARADTAAATAMAERAEAVLRAEDRASLPDSGFLDALSDETMTRLRADYRETIREAPVRPIEERNEAPSDPELAARLATQRNAIWDAVRGSAEASKKNLEAARLREATIVRKVAELAPRLAEIRGHMDKIAAQEARLQSDRQLHDVLQNRFARVSQFVQQQAVPVTEARVIAEASPPLQKSSPRAYLLLLLAATAGCTLGVGGAFGREYFDRKMRRSEQIGRELGLRPLGAVARFDAARHARASSVNGKNLPVQQGHSASYDGHWASRIKDWLAGPAGEVLRGVRVAIDSGVRTSGGRIIAVVSPNTGAGKTTLSLALALVAAQGGKRVLLIDADMREPSLTRGLTPGAAGGLTSVVAQRTPFVETGMRHEMGFSFLGQAPGLVASHPSDILASDAMQDMLENLRGRYDYVIVDTPAMLPYIDVVAAAGLFDAAVMVAEWGATTIEDVDQAVSSSSAIAERLVGVIINKSPVTGA